jgi:hypothetical protein
MLIKFASLLSGHTQLCWSQAMLPLICADYPCLGQTTFVFLTDTATAQSFHRPSRVALIEALLLLSVTDSSSSTTAAATSSSASAAAAKTSETSAKHSSGSGVRQISVPPSFEGTLA